VAVGNRLPAGAVQRWMPTFAAMLMVPMLAVPTVAFASSGTSPEARDATVVGRIVDTTAAPMAGVAVTVERTDTGTGLLNSGSPTSAEVTVVARTKTGPDGTYRATLPKSYVPGRETNADWWVRATVPALPGSRKGATSYFEFEVNTAVQEAPDLPLWDAVPKVTVEGYRVDVSLPAPLPPGPGLTRPYITFGSSAVSGTQATIDLRAAEPDANATGRPLAAEGRLDGDVVVRHAEGRTIYHQHLIEFSDGGTERRAQCWVTNGSLHAPFASARSDGVTPRSVTIDLRGQKEVGWVWLRECSTRCVVEVSTDGTAWTPATQVSVESLGSVGVRRVALVVGFDERLVSTRYVRISDRAEGLRVSEVSVWPNGEPAARAPARSPAPPAGIAARDAAEQHSSGGRAAIVAVAVVLLTGVAAAAFLSVRGPSPGRAWPSR
jgi:hypothetical protein